MTGIKSYSVTAGSNVQANTGINWDEGMSPGAVNNSARANMADTRSAFNDLNWFQYGSGDSPVVVPAYASSTSFTVAGVDVTTVYHAGRRVKAVGSGTGTIYGTISSVAFSTNTTVNMTWDSGSLSNEALTIYLSQLPVTGMATGTGKVVLATSPTIASPTISGHATIEGVALAGATGTGNLVLATSPTITTPTISGHPVIEGVTPTGATGTGNMVFSAAPTLTGTAVVALAQVGGSAASTANLAVGTTGSSLDAIQCDFGAHNGLLLNSTSTSASYLNLKFNGTRFGNCDTDGTNFRLRADNEFDVVVGGSGGVKVTSGATSWASISLRSEKKDFVPVGNPSVALSGMSVELGHYQDESSDALLRPFLFIEDALKVWPYAVSPDGKSLRYTDFIPLLIAGWQEHEKLIAAQAAKIGALETRLMAAGSL